MKTYLLSGLLLTAMVFGQVRAGSTESNRTEAREDLSTAELESIYQCVAMNEICRKNLDNIKDYIPEVIIFDENWKIVVTGMSIGYLVQQLLDGAEFVTRILGTDYYSFDFEVLEDPRSILRVFDPYESLFDY